MEAGTANTAMRTNRTMHIAALGMAALVMVLDQISKWLILVLLVPAQGIPGGIPQGITVTPFFNIVLVHNRGISFGLFNTGSSGGAWILTALALAIVVALLFWLRATQGWTAGLSIGAVIGGALGNVIDRVMPSRGAVIDFADFHAFGYHWPAFNLADSAIVVGVGLLLITNMFDGRKAVQ